MEGLFVDLFLQAHRRPPERIVLDFDATDDPVHGEQLGRFFHGYYQEYCFLPLYLFCGDELLGAWLRPADIDGAAGSLKKLMAIVRRIREAWPNVEIVVRGDSGFCREPLMRWCEENDVEYVFGLAKNRRLEAELQGNSPRPSSSMTPRAMRRGSSRISSIRPSTVGADHGASWARRSTSPRGPIRGSW